MNDDIETIKQDVLQQIKPINFGDELNIADILGKEFDEHILSDEPEFLTVDVEVEPETAPILKPVQNNVVCNVCSKVFANARYFRKHYTKHTGRFSCPTCKKTFARKDTKLKHILRCASKTVNGQNIKRRRTFRDEESFKYYCKECNKSFTRRENYDQHVMIHKGIQVICECCQKKLSSFKSFQRHKKRHENPPEKLSCGDCPLKFSLKSNLIRHVKNHLHKNEIICDKCNVCVKTVFILQKHQSQFCINTCAVCTRSFCLEKDLRSHLREEHPYLWYKCNECKTTPFMTRVMQHLQAHTKRLHSIELDFNKCLQERWFITV